jgi:aminopeptidase-like protein
MSVLKALEEAGTEAAGRAMHELAAGLYPLNRSITGDGLRRTLAVLRERIGIEVFEVPSGTQVFDWTVPREWNIQEAYIKGPDGRTVVDFRDSNLHVLNYSVPVQARMPLAELRPHLFTLPERPHAIPYRTSYYKDAWGFCLPHAVLESLPEGEYEVRIDSTLEAGSMSYGELLLEGTSREEVLFSCHCCHPSLANDNLSGIVVAAFLARLLRGQQHRLSYRFVFAPGTIGAIAYLAAHRERIDQIRNGLVLTCVGDAAGFHYKKSRRGAALIDRAMAHALRHSGEAFETLDFTPYGYDERQYCSPGFNLAVGCLMRSIWGTFPEYHTSDDNLEFLKPQALAGSLRLCASVVDILEGEARYRSLAPFCEPQLGKRGLYGATGGAGIAESNLARLWVLNFSDGEHGLLDIATRAGQPFHLVRAAACELEQAHLIEKIED